LRTVRAFAPGHVTGFFAIFDEPQRLVLRGSIGSGFCVELGARAKVSAPVKGKKGIALTVDGKRAKLSDYPVTHYVIEGFLRAGMPLPRRMVISLSHELPIGAGFGMSAAGALSLALALDAFASEKDDPSPFAYRTAHEADVACRTGLGDVVGEAYGGFEVRLLPGIRGVVKRLPFSSDVYLFARNEGISTRQVLTDPGKRRDIISIGSKALQDFLASPTLENFADVSRWFAEETRLATKEIIELTDTLAPVAYAAMVMLGNSVYAFPRPGKEKECESVAERIEASGKWHVWRTRIAERGAYLE
jgi:pantoate kinase